MSKNDRHLELHYPPSDRMPRTLGRARLVPLVLSGLLCLSGCGDANTVEIPENPIPRPGSPEATPTEPVPDGESARRPAETLESGSPQPAD